MTLFDLGKEEKKKCCSYCGMLKPLSEFTAHSHSSDGYDSRCRSCKNGQKRLIRRGRKRAPIAQTRECMICGKTHEKIVYDHDHKTGDFRGWICDSCNISLGRMGDDPNILERAAKYLRGEILNEYLQRNTSLLALYKKDYLKPGWICFPCSKQRNVVSL